MIAQAGAVEKFWSGRREFEPSYEAWEASVLPINDANSEVANSIVAGRIGANYPDLGEGPPLLFVHGSGPGVSAWAN